MRTVLVASVLAIASALTAGCAVTDKQTSVGQYVDDATISTRVKTRMASDPDVSAARIEVETLNGTVQLAGFAKSQEEKDKAAQIARSVPDVKDVRNNIIVRPAQQ
jgi:hyperosmotically inducible periplasmic protein